METKFILDLIYLVASVTFVIGLKMLSHPDSARKGNLVAAFGMTLAILGTIFIHETEVDSIIYILIFSSIGLGTVAGWVTAKKVQMTKMPELVSIFNGMGGACAALISLIEFQEMMPDSSIEAAAILLTSSSGLLKAKLAMIAAGLVIGSVSFSGSVIAWAKLNGTMNKPIRLPSYNILNTAIMIGLFLYPGIS